MKCEGKPVFKGLTKVYKGDQRGQASSRRDSVGVKLQRLREKRLCVAHRVTG